MNGELRVGSHVLFHDNKRGINRDALILVIFEQNGPPPPLTLVLVRPGMQGIQTRAMVPHRDDTRNQREDGYWLRVEEMNS